MPDALRRGSFILRLAAFAKHFKICRYFFVRNSAFFQIRLSEPHCLLRACLCSCKICFCDIILFRTAAQVHKAAGCQRAVRLNPHIFRMKISVAQAVSVRKMLDFPYDGRMLLCVASGCAHKLLFVVFCLLRGAAQHCFVQLCVFSGQKTYISAFTERI